MEKKLYFILMTIFVIGLVSSGDFSPQGDINLRNIYDIKNGVNANFTLYFGNGSQLTSISSDTSNFSNFANSSTFWAGHNSTNSTQFENNNGVLNIILSWFSSEFDSLFSVQTTDNLTEGTTNLYSQWITNVADIGYTAGNVGIGTSSPSNVLDVQGGIDSFTLNTGQGDNELYSMNQDVSTTSSIVFQEIIINGNATVLGTLTTADLQSTTVNSTVNITDLTGATTIFLNGILGSGLFNGDLTANTLSGILSWTNLTNYPVACPAGTAVTEIGDSSICTSFGIADYEFGANNFNGSGDFTTTGTGTYTNVTATQVNTTQLFFGNSSSSFNDNAPNRPLVSQKATDITVCSSGCDFTIIQDAINTVPYMLRHKYRIFINEDLDYNEDLWIPPVIVSDITDNTEGSTDALRIIGNCSNINGVIVNSIHVTSSQGAVTPNIGCMTVDGIDPHSDENVSIAVYGSNQAQFGDINITANSKYGIMAYSSNVATNGIILSGPTNGFLLKRMSLMNIGDIDKGTNGTLSGVFVVVNSGFADIEGNHVTGFTSVVGCGSKSGWAKDTKKSYCIDEFNEDIQNFSVKNSGTVPMKIRRSTGDLQFLSIEVNDDSAIFTSVQDEVGNGGYVFNAEENRTIADAYKFITNSDVSPIEALTIRGDGLITIANNLTFALGEIIDNLIDGWLTITGSLQVTGDLNVTGTVTSANINEVLYVQAGNVSDIQTKIDLCSSSGCTVVIPKGDYNTSELVSSIFLKSNLDIKCDAGAILYRDTEIHMINTIEKIYNMSLIGCIFDAGSETSLISKTSIKFSFGAENILFRDNTFRNSFGSHMIKFNDFGVNTADNVRFENNNLLNIESGVDIEGDYFYFINNYGVSRESTSGGNASGEALDHNEGNNSVVIGNILLNFRQNALDVDAHNSVISNNIITMKEDNILSDGIKFRDYSTVSNNIIKNINGPDRGLKAYENGSNIYGNILIGNGTGIGIILDNSNFNNLGLNTFIDLTTDISDGGSSNYAKFSNNMFLDSLSPIIFFNDTTMSLGVVKTASNGGRFEFNSGFSPAATESGYIFNIDDGGGGAEGQLTFKCSNDVILKTTCVNDGDSTTFTFRDDNGDKLVVDSSGDVTIPILSGTGNDFACLDSTGKLFRSATACA